MMKSGNAPSVYDDRFFAYTSSSSRRSANAAVPEILEILPFVSSVVDFGCAQGVWLKTWQDNEILDIQGVDGDYVDRERLFIPEPAFKAADLNTEIDLRRKFDLAYSFEVAEHLRPENAENFVLNLTRHANIILFSAAPPGQGGENHINEQVYDYWRNLFTAQGYSAYDAIRPRLAPLKTEVSFWYRYNMILYVKNGSESLLEPDVLASKIPDDRSIVDISPLPFQLRKAVVRMMPNKVQNALARLKATVSS